MQGPGPMDQGPGPLDRAQGPEPMDQGLGPVDQGRGPLDRAQGPGPLDRAQGPGPGTKVFHLTAKCPGLLLLRDDRDFQSWDSGTQTLCGPYTADIQSLYSEYTGCADWRMPDFGGKS